MERNINEKGLELIKSFEGYRSKPYLCSAGKATIGFGTTYYPDGVKVTLKDRECTEDQAYYWLKHEVNEKANVINNYLNKIGLKLNDNQFSALVSFAYNLGIGPIIEGGRSLNIALKTGQDQSICNAILLYNKVTKTILGIPRKVEEKGLVRRRQAEVELFMTKSV